MDFYQNVDIKGVLDANGLGLTLKSKIVDLIRSTSLDTVYPIGSIYITTSASTPNASSSPASFLGGSWERIEDRFLLAAGSSYSAGSTGGEATHTLTVDEMPSHNHGLYRELQYGTKFEFTGSIQYLGGDDFYTGENSITVQNTGGGQAHNNMPPYLAVFVWKRIA